jgi:HEAT repeat protein
MLKNKYVFIGLAIALLLVLAAIFLDPNRLVWGWLRGEAFFDGRPTTYWLKAMMNPDSAIQATSRQRLQEGGKAAVPVLLALLEENDGPHWENEEVRWKVAGLLGELGKDAADAVPPLIQMLNDEDLHVRTVAATSLGALASESREAIPNLTALLPAGGRAGAAAARALGRFGPAARPALPALLEAMKDKEAEVRWTSAMAVGKIGPEAREAVPALVALFRDEDPLVREHAAESLGDIGPDAHAAVPALTEILNDPVARVRRDAVRSLGQIGSAARPATEKVKSLLKDKDEKVRAAAAKTVRILTGKAPEKSGP